MLIKNIIYKALSKSLHGARRDHIKLMHMIIFHLLDSHRF